MKRLLEIAQALAVLRRGLKDHQIELAHWEADIAARELFLTPVDGWTGKNAEQRDTAKAQALASDETVLAIRARQSTLRDQIAEAEGAIEDLEAQRRGLEWDARERLTDALAGKRNGREPVEQAGHDDAADAEALDRVPF